MEVKGEVILQRVEQMDDEKLEYEWKYNTNRESIQKVQDLIFLKGENIISVEKDIIKEV